jgi:hypothetical protein
LGIPPDWAQQIAERLKAKKLARMDVYTQPSTWEWLLGTKKDYLGTIYYNPEEPSAKELAVEVARGMRAKETLNDTKEDVRAGAVAVEIAVRMANAPLDFVATTVEVAKEPTRRTSP